VLPRKTVEASRSPQFIVQNRETGSIARHAREFANRILFLAENPEELQRMREAARADACSASWDTIFEDVYARVPSQTPKRLRGTGGHALEAAAGGCPAARLRFKYKSP
jgi:glycosyltransferase involved in cell wall biosynthesis